MRGARGVALVMALVVACACAPKVEEPKPVEDPATTAPPVASHPEEMLRGRVHAAGGDFVFEPCGGSAATNLPGSQAPLAELLAELGSGEPPSVFAILEKRGTGVLRAVHVAPEGRGCDIDWSGILLRASGNEPFWSMDERQDSLVLRRPDRSDRVFTLDRDGSRNAGRAPIRGHDAEGKVTLQIADVPCRDGMSGAWFALTATATVDGESLEGCAVPGDPVHP